MRLCLSVCECPRLLWRVFCALSRLLVLVFPRLLCYVYAVFRGYPGSYGNTGGAVTASAAASVIGFYNVASGSGGVFSAYLPGGACRGSVYASGRLWWLLPVLFGAAALRVQLWTLPGRYMALWVAAVMVSAVPDVGGVSDAFRGCFSGCKRLSDHVRGALRVHVFGCIPGGVKCLHFVGGCGCCHVFRMSSAYNVRSASGLRMLFWWLFRWRLSFRLAAVPVRGFGWMALAICFQDARRLLWCFGIFRGVSRFGGFQVFRLYGRRFRWAVFGCGFGFRSA